MDPRRTPQVRVNTALVAGGAGFIGSHLCDRLLASGRRVIAVDSFLTGRPENVAHLAERPEFQLIEHDVCEPLDVEGPVEAVFHLASPASPTDFDRIPEEIMWVNALGTRNLCDLAQRDGARLLLASTSEIYGDPLEHPQRESYFGNVNPIGPRSPYDESKRFAESLVMMRRRMHGLNARVVRIFNTYGPRMRVGDGRMSIEFVTNALRGEPLTVVGDGSQTRSLCFVTDMAAGISRAMFRPDTDGQVFNLGNPSEHSVAEYAELIRDIADSSSEIRHVPARPDDPQRRRPDIGRAQEVLDWQPQISPADGLRQTVDWYREHLALAEPN